MKESITLKEFSERHKIKKPTVNARLKRLEKNNPDKTLSFKSGNVIYLTGSGVSLLEKSFKESPVKAPVKAKRSRRSNGREASKEAGLIELYREQVKQLEGELKAVRRENEKLLSLIETMAASNSDMSKSLGVALKDSHTLLNQEQSLALIDKTATQTQRKRKSLLARLAVAGKVIRGEYD